MPKLFVLSSKHREKRWFSRTTGLLFILCVAVCNNIIGIFDWFPKSKMLFSDFWFWPTKREKQKDVIHADMKQKEETNIPMQEAGDGSSNLLDTLISWSIGRIKRCFQVIFGLFQHSIRITLSGWYGINKANTVMTEGILEERVDMVVPLLSLQTSHVAQNLTFL